MRCERTVLILMLCLGCTFFVAPSFSETPKEVRVMEPHNLYKLMLNNTVKLTSENVYHNTARAYATGFVISPHYVATAFHILSADHRIVIKSSDDTPEMEGGLIFAYPQLDFAILEFKDASFSPTISFAVSVHVTEPMYGVSNDGGYGLQYNEYFVGAIREQEATLDGDERTVTRIFLKTSVVSGSSGSAIYNQNGEIIGMITDAMIASDTNETISQFGGIALSAEHMVEVIRKYQHIDREKSDTKE